MKSSSKKPSSKKYPLNGHRAFYVREERRLSPAMEKDRGKVRVTTLMDLFAGAGGFTQGFVQAGFVPIFAVENDVDAAATYNANFGSHCLTADINDVKRFPAADVIIGGPPCQGFSNLGSHIPDDPRNQLWRHFVRAVEQSSPLVFVVENVPPLLRSEEGQELVRETQAMGYQVVGRILNAADYGVPQTRKRTIIIGTRIGKPEFPKQTHVDPKKRDLTTSHLSDWVTVRQAIGDLPLELMSSIN